MEEVTLFLPELMRLYQANDYNIYQKKKEKKFKRNKMLGLKHQALLFTLPKNSF